MKKVLVVMGVISTVVSSLWSMDVISIIDSVNARDDGVQISRHLKMELTDKRGKKRVQETLFFRKYYGEDKKSVMFYKKPKRLKGTAFLTYDNFSKDDEQWLYLPALRKVRRVSASDRGDWFLGTDFSYEDIKKESKISKEDYDFKLLGEEKVDAFDVYKIEFLAKNSAIAEELKYSKLISYIDKNIFIARRVLFYDSRGELLKTLNATEISKVDGIWTIHHMNMKNHQNNHVSDFYFSKVDYTKEVKDNLFSKGALKRGK